MVVVFLLGMLPGKADSFNSPSKEYDFKKEKTNLINTYK